MSLRTAKFDAPCRSHQIVQAKPIRKAGAVRSDLARHLVDRDAGAAAAGGDHDMPVASIEADRPEMPLIAETRSPTVA